MRDHKPVYLDYHSTTPVDSKVVEAMLPYFTEEFGNAASRSHPYGWKASEAVELSRSQIAKLVGGTPEEIFFNSGATEGLNFLLKELARSLQKNGRHIITASTEHPAVLDTLHWIKNHGYDITTLPVSKEGLIDPDDLKKAIRNDTIFVSLMWANNETGVIHDMQSIGQICKEHQLPLISDATQAVGKINVDPKTHHVDMMVMSAHKFYGPKGVGAVWINERSRKLIQHPLLHGGGHEGGLRSGTLNVPGIVGMGKAAELSLQRLPDEMQRILILRDEFENHVMQKVQHVFINGSKEQRLPTVSNVCVEYTDSQAVMTKMRTRLSISSGSACSSLNPSPSHVLLAMGLSEDQAKSSFRISFGMPTTSDEINFAKDLFTDEVKKYRSDSPVWQMIQKGIHLPDAKEL